MLWLNRHMPEVATITSIPHHRDDIMIDFVDAGVGKHLIKSHPAAVLGTNMELSETPGVRHYRYASAV